MPSPAQLNAALHAAVEHHQRGRYAPAEAIYRQVLAVDPKNFDALHMLGVLSHQLGRHGQAADLIEQAVLQDRANPFAKNNLGEAYRALEKLEDAKQCFQSTLSLMPSYAEAHNNLGLILQAQGKSNEAAACFDKALALKPAYPKAHYNMGNLHKAEGRAEAAIACYDKALTLKPDYHEALYALAALFNRQGQLRKALLCCQKTLDIQEEDQAHWTLYADILRLLDEEAAGAVDISRLRQAFAKDFIDPQNLERIAVVLICKEAAAARLLPDIDENASLVAQRVECALADGSLTSFIADPLLNAVLENCIVTDYRLEKLLAAIRHALIRAVSRADIALQNETLAQFTCALALQCFANEYIYALTEEEEQSVQGLAQNLAAILERKESCHPSSIAVLACYRALHTLHFAGKIETFSWPAFAQKLMQRQLKEPNEEVKLKTELPRLTAIDDGVSQAVRQQYEQNPYPRWRRRGNPGEAQSLHAALRRRFPLQNFASDSPENPEILIAGCGTGSDAIQMINTFKEANILAVDMSLSSLAYAKRAAREFGIANIEFGQADILELASLNRQFDLVVCSGVLHHMRDPMAGWRVLLKLLRPNGYMNIGLYSRRARTEITALRKLIEETGYPSTAEGIRRFRTDVMKGDCAIDIGDLSRSPDFYSISACRDLVFHVQEHVFSPLEIQACLDELGLQFLGFDLPNPEAKKYYLERFPDNPACDSLANWDAVEQEHPQIFAGMYQSWLRKI